jgi:hypothetical protein
MLAILLELLYLPWLGISAQAGLSFTVVFVTFGALVFGTRLMAFNLARAAPWLPIGGIGILAALGGAAGILGHVTPAVGFATWPANLDRLPSALPPGSWVMQAFKGDLGAELQLLSLAIGVTVCGIALAGDCYPELWSSSSRVFAVRRAIRSRGGMFSFGSGSRELRASLGRTARRSRVHSTAGTRAPGGALSVFWKEWLSVKRSRGGLRLQGVVLVVAAVAGLLAGSAAARGSTIAGFLAANIVLFFIIWSWASSIQLGRDLGNPLWWLSNSALWTRLAVWTLARAVRFAAPLVVFVSFGLGFWGHYAWALVIAPLPPLLLCWLTQAAGVGAYALLPARTDFRLALMVRSLAVWAIFLPLGVATLPGALFRNAALVVLLPSLVAVAAIAGLIAFATWRIQGNGLAFAREERQ